MVSKNVRKSLSIQYNTEKLYTVDKHINKNFKDTGTQVVIRSVDISVIIWNDNVDLQGKNANDESSRISLLSVCIEDDTA